MDIQYTGEHLLPGQLGRLSIIIAFVFAFTATAAYAIATTRNDEREAASWRRLGRVAFLVHGAAILGIVASLFYIIFNHYFEYQYAYQHSSLALPFKYILSCFWEGQEGSFLLWMFWHMVLGIVLIFRAGKFEAPVLAVVAITQVFLGSMLLGVYIGDYKLGTNPFLLLRQTMDAPIFAQENYLQFVTDGNGLNPLLQNYWMTIHPPTLFLGFASTVVPFAYVIASLWKKDYSDWVRPAMSWGLFAMAVLGVGILMGGAWAYESLTFGGFWAWDPVENASLVPWLTLVGAVHGLLIYKHTGRALRLTYVLFIATFLFILYSTFLTRSGILGDTSVHSFTDLGMSGQLLFFMLFFVVLSLVFFVVNWKNIPSVKEEERIASREFWLFIGALIFTLSALQIIFTTSIPVWNKLLEVFTGDPQNFAPPTNPAQHYNKIQVWIAIVIALLSAVIQFLRYKNSDVRKFFKSLVLPALIAVVLTAVIAVMLEIYPAQYILLLFAALFSVAANFEYLFLVLKGRLHVGGASIAHVGFALILIGALIPNYTQDVISVNTQGIDPGEAFDAKAKRENIVLWRNLPVRMQDYWVTYKDDSVSGPDNFYKVHYARIDEKTGDVREEFVLYPNAQINPDEGLIANPDTRHYFSRDIYTHVTQVPKKEAIEGSYRLDTILMLNNGMKDTFYLDRAYGVIENIELDEESKKGVQSAEDFSAILHIKLFDRDGREFTAKPVYQYRNKEFVPMEVEVKELGVTLSVVSFIPERDKLSIVLAKKQRDMENDYIVMKAIVFPYINVLWLGSLMMAFGILVSMVKRMRDRRRV